MSAAIMRLRQRNAGLTSDGCQASYALSADPGNSPQAVEELDAQPDSKASPSDGRMAEFTSETLQAAVADLVADLTGQRPALDQPLAAQGLDSLAAMELRQKLQACHAAPLTYLLARRDFD